MTVYNYSVIILREINKREIKRNNKGTNYKNGYQRLELRKKSSPLFQQAYREAHFVLFMAVKSTA